MLHEDPFRFMRLATSLERAGQTARVIDVKYHSVGPTSMDESEEKPGEAAQWVATLRFCCGVEPFLKRPDNVMCGRAVASFLLFDPSFPRSVLHNLNRTRNFLDLLGAGEPGAVGSRARTLVSEATDYLAKRNIEDILDAGLHETATWVVDSTTEIAGEIIGAFFHPAADVTQSQSQSQS